MLVVDRRVLKERREKVVATVQEAGHDAVLVFAQGSAVGSASRAHGYMRYLTDWDGYTNISVLLLIPNQEPVILATNVFHEFLAKEGYWIDDVRFVLPPSLGAEAVKILRERVPQCRKLALLGRAEMVVPFWQALTEGLAGVEFTDVENLVDPFRTIKDSLQYSIHSRGAEICDQMFDALRQFVRKGIPTYQIQSAVEKVARDVGAEYVQTWLTIRPAADYSRFRREECLRTPMYGDQVLLGIYLLYQGHWAHAIRMGTYGPPSKAQERAFDIVYEMQEAGLKVLQPGGNLYDVNRAFDQVMAKHFSPEALDKLFIFRHAHGLGHSYEDPITSNPFPQPYGPKVPSLPSDHILIEPGMLFEFHPNYFEHNVAGGALGDMIFVTEKGPEIMTKFPRIHVRWDV